MNVCWLRCGIKPRYYCGYAYLLLVLISNSLHTDTSYVNLFFLSLSLSLVYVVPYATGTMVAQQYGIGGAPWVNRKSTSTTTNHPSSEGSDWGLDAYFASTGRPESPALAPDLTGGSAGTWFSIGAPYIAVASDWLPLATNWYVLACVLAH